MDNLTWHAVDVPAYWEEKAKRIREKRDTQYGNIFPEEDSDLRWVGDLGEIWFNNWLKQHEISNFRWHLDNAAGKPDFTINNVRIDVKTVKRKVPPKPGYTAQITARHKDHPIDELFFLSYEFEVKRLWLLGGISMQAFLASATYYGEGDAVHENYTIRQGHEIYNAEIGILTPPGDWLKKFRRSETA
jgi:hypothetical protein